VANSDDQQSTASRLPAAARPRGVFATLLRFLELGWKRDSSLHTTGLWRSYRENRPVDAEGQPLPRFDYALINLIDERLRPGHRGFEYGSGYSTRYFAMRVADVTGVEHDSNWIGGPARVPAGQRLAHRSPIAAAVSQLERPEALSG
jgi:hypothetical protein